jgi:hypothetical protein
MYRNSIAFSSKISTRGYAALYGQHWNEQSCWLATARDERSSPAPAEGRHKRIAVGFEWRRDEGRRSALVLRLDPGERVLPVDVLEPEVRIVIRCRNRRS